MQHAPGYTDRSEPAAVAAQWLADLRAGPGPDFLRLGQVVPPSPTPTPSDQAAAGVVYPAPSPEPLLRTPSAPAAAGGDEVTVHGGGGAGAPHLKALSQTDQIKAAVAAQRG